MIDIPLELPLKKGLVGSLTEREGLRRSLNVYPKDDTMKSVKTISELWAATEVWPWPQLFQLADSIYVCYSDSISVVTEAGLMVLLDSISTRNYPWSATVMGQFPVFMNNYVVVHPTEMSALVARRAKLQYDTLAVQTDMPVGSDICNVNGQFVISSPWIYGKWHSEHVIWAIPGTIDFTLDSDKSSGLRHVQGCGQIMRVVESEDGFYAYGTEGVAKFEMAEYPSQYRHVKISRVGLYSHLAVVRGVGFQMYVGTDLKLHLVGDKPKELGYDYVFERATGEISLHYDEQEGIVYASL